MKKITIFQPNVTEKCCISEENFTLKGTQDNVHFELTFFLIIVNIYRCFTCNTMPKPNLPNIRFILELLFHFLSNIAYLKIQIL